MCERFCSKITFNSAAPRRFWSAALLRRFAIFPFSPKAVPQLRDRTPQEHAFSDGRSKEKRQSTAALQNLADHSRARLPRSVLECASPLALLLRPQSQRAAPLTMPCLVAKFSIAFRVSRSKTAAIK